MILPIVKYGHPALRKPGARIETVTPEIRQLAADMIETMHAAQGVGLAAQQVGQALQMCVIDVREAKDRPSWVEKDGVRIDVATIMPLVLINPSLELEGDRETGPEGCLSFPEVFADIARPAVVSVRAIDEHGKPIAFRCGGLLSRAIQHEYDHLRGVLFIDRMSGETKRQLRSALDELQASTQAELKGAKVKVMA
ncbi:MAG TPA: peptide deformylase [Verrucomicrobiota bacterium]|nr:peptide deformylase [Verrucomicrobiota bacterium]HOK76329.1 peptide deformylase [Verrucomicrobiota bacterium]